MEFKVTHQARKKLHGLLSELYNARDKAFGNGRLVRNLFERIIEKQANRIADITPLTEKILSTISKDDVPDKEELE